MNAPITALSLIAVLAAPAPKEKEPLLPSKPAVVLARKVQAFYERTRDWQADFWQTYAYAGARPAAPSKGTLKVKKPGKLRWDYASPQVKTIVVNGSRLVQFEPEDGQAYVDDEFDASAMSAAVTFLLGRGSLEKEFELSMVGEELVLTPRTPDARVAKVVLRVGGDGEVQGTRVVDGSGNVNELAFTSIRRNAGLSDGEFELKLPADVHLVRPPQ